MMDEALDRIEKFTDDVFGWLETNVRRLGKQLPSRPGARPPRSVATGDRGRVEGDPPSRVTTTRRRPGEPEPAGPY
jgi:hypothetical protein